MRFGADVAYEFILLAREDESIDKESLNIMEGYLADPRDSDLKL